MGQKPLILVWKWAQDGPKFSRLHWAHLPGDHRTLPALKAYRSRKARAILANVVLDPRKIIELLQDCLPESHQKQQGSSLHDSPRTQKAASPTPGCVGHRGQERDTGARKCLRACPNSETNKAKVQGPEGFLLGEKKKKSLSLKFQREL